MPHPQLDNLVRSGLLKPEPAEQSELDGLIESAARRLHDAENEALSLDGRFDLLYNAAHALALAALRWHGYRPANNRYVVFQALAHTLALAPDEWRVLSEAHRKRNAIEYEGVVDVDEQLVAAVMRVARLVNSRIHELGPVSGTV
jgi:sarcosine oxidase gamma subunit